MEFREAISEAKGAWGMWVWAQAAFEHMWETAVVGPWERGLVGKEGRTCMFIWCLLFVRSP